MPGILDVLNSQERTQLRNCEEIIQRHLGTFMDVGSALAEIRDNRLYRESYKTFEKYVTGRWDFETRHAYRLIAAAQVAENVSHGTQIVPSLLPSLTERTVRPLTELSPEQQAAAFDAAVERAQEAGGPVTAAIVAQVVEGLKPAAEGNGKPKSNGETPDVAASVLLAMNTEAIKPTPQQLAKLAAMPEKQQDAVMASVESGAKLGTAIKESAGPKIREKPATPADEAKAQVKIWSDTIGRWLGKSPSIDELRAKWPGPKGDAVLESAKVLYESLKTWQKSIR